MNSKKNSKARKTRNRKQSKNRSGFQSVAPVAVSDDIQQSVRFGAGDNPGDLRIHATIPLYQVCSGWTSGILTIPGGFVSTADPTTLIPPETSVQLGIGIGLHSNNQLTFPYLSPAVSLISNAFTRYRMRKLQFIYEPQSSTIVQDRTVFAYAEDPRHPLFYAPNDASQLSSGKLLALSDSIAFAPWRSWSLDVSKSVTQNLMYTAIVDTSPYLGQPQLSDQRFSMFGTIGCVTSNTTYTGPVIYGILYARMEVDLVEFCPIVQTAIVPLGGQKSDDCDDKTCPRCSRMCKHSCDDEEVEEKPVRASGLAKLASKK